jgi:hypothetical protein
MSLSKAMIDVREAANELHENTPSRNSFSENQKSC